MYRALNCTWAEEDQAGLQSLQLNLRLEVVDLHGAEDLTHGHVQLIQTGYPTDAGRKKSGLLYLYILRKLNHALAAACSSEQNS